MSEASDQHSRDEQAKEKAEKPVDFAGINLHQKQVLIMQYLFGALDNWRDDIGMHKSKQDRTECEDELCKSVDQLRELCGKVHGRKTLL